MIFGTIEGDLALFVGLICGLIGMVAFAAIALIGLVARHIRNDYRKQGGAPALAKKVAGGIASRMLRQWILGRFR